MRAWLFPTNTIPKPMFHEENENFWFFFYWLARNWSKIVKNHLVNIQWTIRSHLWPILSIFQNFQFLEICGCSFNHQYFENFSILGQFWWIFWLSFNKSWCFLLQKSIKDAFSSWNSSKLTQKVRFLTFIAFMIINFLKIFNFLANFYEFSVIHLLILD